LNFQRIPILGKEHGNLGFPHARSDPLRKKPSSEVQHQKGYPKLVQKGYPHKQRNLS
jgi:hypothetical protein